ncbi:MAG: DUF4149 domain-containing protein [Chloroflexi bacterium]|nr:DUF4149 domain-containing protein [Chloroflexota bacterium]
MHALYVLSVWLHILAVVVWVGGMMFLGVVLVPALRRPEHRSLYPSVIQVVGTRFRWVGWVALGLLVASGLLNLSYRVGWSGIVSAQLWRGDFGLALAIKLGLVAVILLLSAAHDFAIGPRAGALMRADPASRRAMRMRRLASWMGRGNLLLALAVVALGVIMVRGWP